MQIDAQTIVRDGETTTTVLSPWFPREASDVRVLLEVIAVSGTAVKLTLKVDTKDTDAADSSLSTLGTSISRTGSDGPSNSQTTFDGIRGLLRFRYEVTLGSEGDWFLYRVQPLLWWNEVRKT